MNELEGLLARAVQDPVVRPRFYEKLTESTLYVLTPVPAAEGRRTLETDEHIEIVHWQDGDNQIIPIFSSLERLNEAVRPTSEEYGYLGVRGRELFGILAQGGMPAVLNPNWTYGREFLPDEIARLAAGTFSEPLQTEIVARERSVLVGKPREYPDRLVAALKRHFSKTPEVAAAYLALYVDPKIGPDPRLVVTIAGTGVAGSVVRDAGLIAREIVEGGAPVDFVVVAEGDDTPLSGEAAPFYERGEYIWSRGIGKE